jgi:hypothetical protein
MWEDFIAWQASDPQAEPYRHLCWEDELKNATEKASPEVRL